eukprot:gene27897-3274_t
MVNTVNMMSIFCLLGGVFYRAALCVMLLFPMGDTATSTEQPSWWEVMGNHARDLNDRFWDTIMPPTPVMDTIMPPTLVMVKFLLDQLPFSGTPFLLKVKILVVLQVTFIITCLVLALRWVWVERRWAVCVQYPVQVFLCLQLSVVQFNPDFYFSHVSVVLSLLANWVALWLDKLAYPSRHGCVVRGVLPFA